VKERKKHLARAHGALMELRHEATNQKQEGGETGETGSKRRRRRMREKEIEEENEGEGY
jgi:hypothetical protein